MILTTNTRDRISEHLLLCNQKILIWLIWLSLTWCKV